MTEHTPGRLKIGRIDHKEQVVEIDAESNTAWLNTYPWTGLIECFGCEEFTDTGSKVMEANARRLVACWNYAEKLGLSTEEMEKML